MNRISPLRLLSLTVLGACLFVQPTSADNSTTNAAPGSAISPRAPSTNSPTFRVEVRDQEVRGIPAFRCAYLTAGTNKFGFRIPDGFRLEASNPERLTMSNADYSTLLVLRVLGPLPVDQSQAQACRQLLLKEYPDATILEEFSLSACSRTGPAFDFQWTAAGNLTRRSRVAFIPVEGVVLECGVVSTPEGFEAARQSFDELMVILRASDASGELRMPSFSNSI